MRCAAIQMNSGEDVALNARTACRLLREAAESGATFALLPENALLMPESLRPDHPGVMRLEKPFAPLEQIAEAALTLKMTVAVGSVASEPKGGDGRLVNRMIVFSPEGKRMQSYDKIHLFDADVPGDRSYRESSRFAPGVNAATFGCNNLTFGCAICYDLRFPELFRALTLQGGAHVLLLPAAFTAYTGALHWEPLLRARAIENGCYVIAAAQYGAHPGGRDTYGHSCIIDPWGKIIARLPEGEGVVLADLSEAACADMRARLPSCTAAPAFGSPRGEDLPSA